MDVPKRFRMITNTPLIGQIRQLRDIPKQFDVVFLSTHYDGAAYRSEMDFREELIRCLRGHPALNCRASFVSDTKGYNLANGLLRGEGLAKNALNPIQDIRRAGLSIKERISGEGLPALLNTTNDFHFKYSRANFSRCWMLLSLKASTRSLGIAW